MSGGVWRLAIRVIFAHGGWLAIRLKTTGSEPAAKAGRKPGELYKSSLSFDVIPERVEKSGTQLSVGVPPEPQRQHRARNEIMTARALRLTATVAHRRSRIDSSGKIIP
jgi:hypothetical protein